MAETGLNDSQVEAVAQAYATDLLHLIQGLPGTGKTYLLAQLKRQSQSAISVRATTFFFDEASQLTLPLGNMGMLAGSKYIFIGDENQLQPVLVFSEKEAAWTSSFSYFARSGNDRTLNTTYRLNNVLGDWSRRTFYQVELKPSTEAAKRRLHLSDQASRWDYVLDPASHFLS